MNNTLQMPFPHNLEAEKAVIGSVLRDPECISEIDDVISGEDFYFPAHKIIYNCLKEMYRSTIDIDMTTLCATLDAKGKLNEVGGYNYLFEIIDLCVTSANVYCYAEIVHNRYQFREIIRKAHELEQEAFSMENPIDLILSNHQSKLVSILGNSKSCAKHISENLQDTYSTLIKHFNTTKAGEESPLTINTGLVTVDKKFGGLPKIGLVILAGKTSGGKTAFLTNILSTIANHSNVLLFSLEMSLQEIQERLISSIAKIDIQNPGEMKGDDWDNFQRSKERIASLHLYVDTTSRKVEDVVSRSRQFTLKHGRPTIIGVDYHGLFMPDRSASREDIQIEQCLRQLKLLSGELETCVIDICQYNRESMREGENPRPSLKCLKGSSGIEQHANKVLHLWEDPNKGEGTVTIICDKNRNGPTGEAMVSFNKQWTKFYCRAEGYDVPPDWHRGRDDTPF